LKLNTNAVNYTFTITTSASNSLSDQYLPENVLNNVNGSYWDSGSSAPGWIRFDFSHPYYIDGIKALVLDQNIG